MRCGPLLTVWLMLWRCAGFALQTPALGIGMHPCMQWNAAVRKSGAPAAEQASWLLGYFSGANVAQKSRSASFFFSYDEKNLLDFETSYCRAHPGLPIVSGAAELLESSQRSRPHGAP